MSNRNNDEDETQYQTIITKNVIKTGEIMGIPKRRFIEAGIAILLFAFFLFAISFTSIVRNVTLIVYGSTIVFIFIRGIHNRSVVEHLIATMRFRKTKRILHLVGPEYERLSGLTPCTKDSSKSDAERLMDYLKDKVNTFVDENADI